ncbi:MAG TPA: hypothetical protein VIQ97_00965 [Prevotella sp.]
MAFGSTNRGTWLHQLPQLVSHSLTGSYSSRYRYDLQPLQLIKRRLRFAEKDLPTL